MIIIIIIIIMIKHKRNLLISSQKYVNKLNETKT